MIEKAALILRFLFFLACLQNYDCTDSAATTLPPVVTTTVGIPAQTTGGAPAAVNPANVASTPKNPAPKPNLSGATTKKCGSEDCSEVLFEGRVIRDGVFNHEAFLKYKVGDVVKIYAIEFSDRADLWEGEVNGTRGLVYKNHIDQEGFYRFLVEAVEQRKPERELLFLLHRHKPTGVQQFIDIEQSATVLAKQYEVTKKKFEEESGVKPAANQDSADSNSGHHDHDHDHHGHGHSHGDPHHHHGHSHGGFYENRMKAKAAAPAQQQEATKEDPAAAPANPDPAAQSPTAEKTQEGSDVKAAANQESPSSNIGEAEPKLPQQQEGTKGDPIAAPATPDQTAAPTPSPAAEKIKEESEVKPAANQESPASNDGQAGKNLTQSQEGTKEAPVAAPSNPGPATPPAPSATAATPTTPPPATPSEKIEESGAKPATNQESSAGDNGQAEQKPNPTGLGDVGSNENQTSSQPEGMKDGPTAQMAKPDPASQTMPPVGSDPTKTGQESKPADQKTEPIQPVPASNPDSATPPPTPTQDFGQATTPTPVPVDPVTAQGAAESTPTTPSPTAEIKDEFGVEYCIKGDCDQSLDRKKESEKPGNLGKTPVATEEEHHLHVHDGHGHSHGAHDHGHSHGHSHGGHGHSHAPPPPTFFDRLKVIWRATVSTATWTKENARPIVFGIRFILGRIRRLLPKELGESITERDLLLFGTAVFVFVLHIISRLFGERSRRDSILKLSEHAELYEKYMVLKVENDKLRTALGTGGAAAATSSGSGGSANTAQITQQLQEKYEKLILEERERSDAVINELRNDNEHLRQAHDLLDNELAELRRQLSKHGHTDRELKQHQREYDDMKGRYESLNAQLNEYRANFEREREKVDDFERRLAEEQAKAVSKERYGDQLKEEMSAVQALLNESRDEIRRLSDDLAVKSEEVESLKELVTALKLTASQHEERAVKSKHQDEDEEGGKKSSESNGDWDLGEGLDEEDTQRAHQQHQRASSLDLETKLAELTDAAKLRTKIKELEEEREQMKKVLGEEYESKRKLEQQMAEMKTDYDAMKQHQKDAEQHTLQAQTRLQILEEFFQAKQTELQKQLGQQQVLSQQRSELLGTAEERVKRYQDEKAQAEKIAEDLRRELKDVERENSKLRQEADRQRHEAWLANRRNERELEALRLEAAALRARVADVNTSGAKSFVSEQRSPAGSTGGGAPGDDANSSEAELAAIATRESPYLAGGGKMNKSASFPPQPPTTEPPYLPFMPSYPPPPMPPMHLPPPMDYPPPPRSSGHVSPIYGPYGMPPPMDYDDYRRGGPSPPHEYRRGPRSTGNGGGGGGASGAAKRNKSKTRSPPRSPSPPPEDFRRSSGRRSEGAGSSGARRSKSKNRSPPRIPSPSFFRKY